MRVTAPVLSAVLLGAAALAAPVAAVRADDGAALPEGRLSVRGQASVTAPADVLEITFTVTEGSDELADGRERFARRCAGLKSTAEGATKPEGEQPAAGALKLELAWGPVEVGAAPPKDAQQLQMELMQQQMGGQAVPAAPKFHLTRRLTVRVRGVDAHDDAARAALCELIDGLIEQGADDGGGGAPPIFRYELADRDALEAAAYEKAVADARRRAGRLATLCDRALGPVVRVQEVVAPLESGGDDSGDANPWALWFQMVAGANGEARPPAPDAAATIRITKSVDIDFALGPPVPAKKGE